MNRAWYFGLVLIMSCGGSDSGANGGTDDGGSDATVGGNDGGGTDGGTNPNDTGTGADTAPPGDGSPGNDAQVPDGGAASDPGKVVCGKTSCDLKTDYCCVRLQVLNDAGDTCVADDAGGQGCPNGVRNRCDEAADCDAGDVCCFQAGGGGAGAACRTTRCGGGGGGGGIQLCRTNAECPDGGTCTVRTCAGGATLEVCGKPNGCQ